jgi:hypothetical protein
MPTLEETLRRLAVTFTVRDIMVPREQLVCGKSETTAAKISLENHEFNVIPIQRRSQLAGYFERDSGKTKRITVRDLTSDGTSLLDLVEILEGREFCFVLSHSRISGYVHYSDLANLQSTPSSTARQWLAASAAGVRR